MSASPSAEMTRPNPGVPAILGASGASGASDASGASGTKQRSGVVVASATIPTRYGPFRCVVFGSGDGASQRHVAMVRGDVAGEDVLVRIHSECITGDVFASLDCDCASDLDRALRLIANEDRGVVVYLRREGADGHSTATALLGELGVLGILLVTGTETRRLSLDELAALPPSASLHAGADRGAAADSAVAPSVGACPGHPSFTVDSVHSSPQHAPPSGAPA
jgi:hypothetical protein